MPSGVDVFDTTVQKSNLLVNDIAGELGWEDRKKQAYSLLRTVLHLVRDRLPRDEAVNFGAQLPMLLRGAYYEGWKPESVPKKMRRAEFLEEFRRQFPLATDRSSEELIHIVIRHVRNHVDSRLFDDISQELPEDIVELLMGEE